MRKVDVLCIQIDLEYVICIHFLLGFKMKKDLQEFMQLINLQVIVQDST